MTTAQEIFELTSANAVPGYQQPTQSTYGRSKRGGMRDIDMQIATVKLGHREQLKEIEEYASRAAQKLDELEDQLDGADGRVALPRLENKEAVQDMVANYTQNRLHKGEILEDILRWLESGSSTDHPGNVLHGLSTDVAENLREVKESLDTSELVKESLVGARKRVASMVKTTQKAYEGLFSEVTRRLQRTLSGSDMMFLKDQLEKSANAITDLTKQMEETNEDLVMASDRVKTLEGQLGKTSKQLAQVTEKEKAGQALLAALKPDLESLRMRTSIAEQNYQEEKLRHENTQSRLIKVKEELDEKIAEQTLLSKVTYADGVTQVRVSDTPPGHVFRHNQVLETDGIDGASQFIEMHTALKNRVATLQKQIRSKTEKDLWHNMRHKECQTDVSERVELEEVKEMVETSSNTDAVQVAEVALQCTWETIFSFDKKKPGTGIVHDVDDDSEHQSSDTDEEQSTSAHDLTRVQSELRSQFEREKELAMASKEALHSKDMLELLKGKSDLEEVGRDMILKQDAEISRLNDRVHELEGLLKQYDSGGKVLKPASNTEQGDEGEAASAPQQVESVPLPRASGRASPKLAGQRVLVMRRSVSSSAIPSPLSRGQSNVWRETRGKGSGVTYVPLNPEQAITPASRSPASSRGSDGVVTIPTATPERAAPVAEKRHRHAKGADRSEITDDDDETQSFAVSTQGREGGIEDIDSSSGVEYLPRGPPGLVEMDNDDAGENSGGFDSHSDMRGSPQRPLLGDSEYGPKIREISSGDVRTSPVNFHANSVMKAQLAKYRAVISRKTQSLREAESQIHRLRQVIAELKNPGGNSMVSLSGTVASDMSPDAREGSSPDDHEFEQSPNHQSPADGKAQIESPSPQRRQLSQQSSQPGSRGAKLPRSRVVRDRSIASLASESQRSIMTGLEASVTPEGSPGVKHRADSTAVTDSGPLHSISPTGHFAHITDDQQGMEISGEYEDIWDDIFGGNDNGPIGEIGDSGSFAPPTADGQSHWKARGKAPHASPTKSGNAFASTVSPPGQTFTMHQPSPSGAPRRGNVGGLVQSQIGQASDPETVIVRQNEAIRELKQKLRNERAQLAKVRKANAERDTALENERSKNRLARAEVDVKALMQGNIAKVQAHYEKQYACHIDELNKEVRESRGNIAEARGFATALQEGGRDIANVYNARLQYFLHRVGHLIDAQKDAASDMSKASLHGTTITVDNLGLDLSEQQKRSISRFTGALDVISRDTDAMMTFIRDLEQCNQSVIASTNKAIAGASREIRVKTKQVSKAQERMKAAQVRVIQLESQLARASKGSPSPMKEQPSLARHVMSASHALPPKPVPFPNTDLLSTSVPTLPALPPAKVLPTRPRVVDSAETLPGGSPETVATSSSIAGPAVSSASAANMPAQPVTRVSSVIETSPDPKRFDANAKTASVSSPEVWVGKLHKETTRPLPTHVLRASIEKKKLRSVSPKKTNKNKVTGLRQEPDRRTSPARRPPAKAKPLPLPDVLQSDARFEKLSQMPSGSPEHAELYATIALTAESSVEQGDSVPVASRDVLVGTLPAKGSFDPWT